MGKSPTKVASKPPRATRGASGLKKKKPRQHDEKGLAAARKATTMSLAQWKKFQVGMAEKWPAPAYMSDPHPEGKGHTCYRDETFEIVTRFQASTRIAYRPHAKSPGGAHGSKSHVRYEKYAKAKTVGQALRLDCFPVDWCWDYERGFIKVISGLRDEPIDITEVEDETKLTEVDKKVMYWAKKEISHRFGLTMAELMSNKGAGEGLILRAHRLVAQREAKKILASKRVVTDDDVTTVLSNWGFARNIGRQNVMQEGKNWVWSDTLGLLRDRMGDIHITAPAKAYPEVMEVINRWLLDRLPPEAAGFSWTSLNLNKDYAARIHRDGNNFGPSMISAFGNFEGGGLRYYPDDNRKMELESLEEQKEAASQKLDLKQGLALFNGNCAHSVEDFSGNRFSVVYFTVGCHKQMKQEDRAELAALRCNVPSPDLNPFQLIKPPAGYATNIKYKDMKAAASSSKASAKWRYWKKRDLKAKPALSAKRPGKTAKGV
mmetsp:Transcript_16688/g.39025  ORF Transcript_16688/g.39025 Transcript_16688/m.39025 type:complete len:489 (-) Transcript_16688:80-1546(-)